MLSRSLLARSQFVIGYGGRAQALRVQFGAPDAQVAKWYSNPRVVPYPSALSISAGRRTWVITSNDQSHVHQLVRSANKQKCLELAAHSNAELRVQDEERSLAASALRFGILHSQFFIQDMAINYAKLFNRRVTPQSQPIPGSAQVRNSAGGYSWEVDDWTRFDRFLSSARIHPLAVRGRRESFCPHFNFTSRWPSNSGGGLQSGRGWCDSSTGLQPLLFELSARELLLRA